ncbi:hypothetical protein ACHAPJ_005275 [Fusarium lateritium]
MNSNLDNAITQGPDNAVLAMQESSAMAGINKRPVRCEDFTIAIICALPLEADAIYYMFDEIYPNEYHKATKDPNHYTTGRIGRFNVVCVLLPSMGKVHSAAAAASLNASYTNLRVALLVGICGGVPRSDGHGDEILLGDVVISNALIQFDFGRRYPGGLFIRKTSVQDNLSRPNKDLRSLLRSLETDQGRSNLESRAAELLRELQTAHAKRSRSRRRQRDKYNYPGTVYDQLFATDYLHRHRNAALDCCNDTDTCGVALKMSCEECGCDKRYLVLREQLDLRRQLEQEDPTKVQDPVIHIGPVASGDTVMKSGEDRDEIAKLEKVVAFEMEGAGVWDEIPCIVIKGVCDYADSHKHKRWQDFAAATAAASMKALLEALIDTERPRSGEHTADSTSIMHFRDQERRSSVMQQLALMLQGQGQLCMQIPFNLILVVDARGRNLPFHLETINSKELFVEVLKSRFMDLGTKKIERGEWFLEERGSGKRLDLSKPWQSVIQPNQVLRMSMVFRRRNNSSTQCPACQFTNPGISTDEVQCGVCGLTYRRVEEVQGIEFGETRVNTTQNKPNPQANKHSNLPPRPKPTVTQRPEDDVSRYKHVQLVDVNFKFGRTGIDEQLADRTLLLSPHYLQSPEHLAEELVSVYGLSEDDSLALSRMASFLFMTTPGDMYFADTVDQQRRVPKSGIAIESQEEEEPPFRGEFEQLPILLENHEYNPERRFVMLTGSSSGSEVDPRAAPKSGPGRNPRISELARHFEELSREFQEERRAQRRRERRQKDRRKYPLAAGKPFVEVYSDVDGVVGEPSESQISSDIDDTAGDAKAS